MPGLFADTMNSICLYAQKIEGPPFCFLTFVLFTLQLKTKAHSTSGLLGHLSLHYGCTNFLLVMGMWWIAGILGMLYGGGCTITFVSGKALHCSYPLPQDLTVKLIFFLVLYLHLPASSYFM